MFGFLSADKLDSSFSRSRSSSMSSLENISSEAIQCIAFADSYTKKSGKSIILPCQSKYRNGAKSRVQNKTESLTPSERRKSRMSAKLLCVFVRQSIWVYAGVPRFHWQAISYLNIVRQSRCEFQGIFLNLRFCGLSQCFLYHRDIIFQEFSCMPYFCRFKTIFNWM